MRTFVLVLLAGCAAGIPGDDPDAIGDEYVSTGKADDPNEIGMHCRALLGPDAALCNLHPVADGIWRGARPGTRGLDQLAAMGVKTIVDLDNQSRFVGPETEEAAKRGIVVINQPMSWAWLPNDDEMNQTLALLADPSLRPMFVHCKLGDDRTGLVIGLHRVFNQGWAPADAYAEMLQRGFHPLLIGLNHYFEEKTGFED